MAIYQRIRRRRRVRWTGPLILALAAAPCVWWFLLREDVAPAPPELRLAGPDAVLRTERPEQSDAALPPPPDVSEKGDAGPTLTSAEPVIAPEKRPAALVEAGKQAISAGDVIAARSYFSEAVRNGLPEPDLSFVRAELTRIGNETIFSARIFDNDPHIARYIIKPGDTLGKIASAHHVSAELLADINGIRDVNLIRAGQTIKIVKGPFRVVVHKDAYVMEVYLGNTLVRHFRVGLGQDDSTPSGEWRVGTKLKNPTYYPPRSGRVIAADDPENPLGERWIALRGVSGAAIGQQRYGIHGTIERESVGRSVSLGCIRLYNEDVEDLFTYLVEGESTVTVVD